MARSAYREAVGYFEQALSALPHLPETARHTRAGHRPPTRPAHGAPAVWRLWAYPGVSARGRDPRGGPRRPASAGTGLCAFCHAISTYRGAYDQAIAAAQRALALATAGGDVVLHALANQLPRHSLPRPGRLSSGDRLLRADCGVPRWSTALRALRPSFLARRALPCLTSPGAMPSWAHSLRAVPLGKKGCGLPRRLHHPAKPHVGLVGDWSTGPPPRRPAQGAPPARTGRGHLSGQQTSRPVSPWMAAGFGRGVHPGRARRRRRAAAHAGAGTGHGNGNSRLSGAL